MSTNPDEPSRPAANCYSWAHGLTKREHFALEITLALIAQGKSSIDAVELGVDRADKMISLLNKSVERETKEDVLDVQGA